jgi:hypothetical protein
MVINNQTLINLYGVLTSEMFFDNCLELQSYALFLKKEILPYENQQGTKPMHPERKNKYLREEKKAKSILLLLQLVFKENNIENFRMLQKDIQSIPVDDDTCCFKEKIEALLKNFYSTLLHNFDKVILEESILIFSTIEKQRNTLVNLIEQAFILIIKNTVTIKEPNKHL